MKLAKAEQFTRGGNTFKTLNIGKRIEIENWFKTWAPYAKYKIDDNLNIKIKGFLDFYGAKVNSLPDNLYIEGYLNLYKTNIISLPNNLYIEKWLYIEGTKITSLPNDLYVKEKIFR